MEDQDDKQQVKQLRLVGGWPGLRKRGFTASKPTIYRQIKRGEFPKPVYPGRKIDWIEHELDQHILNLIAKRDGVA